MNNKWKETSDRFVAFFDIMGFKDLVARSSHDSVLRRMKKLKEVITPLEKEVDAYLNQDDKTLTDKQKEDFKKSIARPLMFSDSILIVTNEDTEADAQNITFISYWLLTSCFQIGIPIKGAVSHGKFTADFDNSLYFGQPLIDAYLLQEELQFYGVVFDHNFEDLIHKRKLEIEVLNLKKYKVHLKSGKVNHYITDWIYLHQQFKSLTRQIEKLYRSVSGRPRLYVDNTLDCLNHLIDDRKKEKEKLKEEKEKRKAERANKKEKLKGSTKQNKNDKADDNVTAANNVHKP